MIVLLLKVNVAPATVSFDTTPVIVSKLGLYCSVNVPDVAFRPLLSAIGMPLPGMLLAALIVANATVTPGVVELNSCVVVIAKALWNVTSTLEPVLRSLVTTTTEFGVPVGPGGLLPICVARPPLVKAA